MASMAYDHFMAILQPTALFSKISTQINTQLVVISYIGALLDAYFATVSFSFSFLVNQIESIFFSLILLLLGILLFWCQSPWSHTAFALTQVLWSQFLSIAVSYIPMSSLPPSRCTPQRVAIKPFPPAPLTSLQWLSSMGPLHLFMWHPSPATPLTKKMMSCSTW